MSVEKIKTKYYHYKSKGDRFLIFVHGMTEVYQGHMRLCKYLVENGIDVIMYNQYAHGQNCENLGHMAKGEGDILVEELVDIYEYIKETFKKEITVVGYSLGAIIVKRAMEQIKIDKVVLNGQPTPWLKREMLPLYIYFKINSAFRGDKITESFNKLVFERYNKFIDNPKTPFDWVTRDERFIRGYLKFKNVAFVGTWSFYHELVKLGVQEDIKKQIPTKIMMTSGTDDPVTKFGKVVKQEHKRYVELGFESQVVMYEGFRHFIYYDLEFEQVFKDLLDFVNS